MIEQENAANKQTYSRGAIAKATGIAFLVALVILFTAVLPAEYGIDTLKTGAALHLTDLSKAAETKPPGKTVLQTGQAVVNVVQPQIYKVDSEDLTLFPGDG